MSKKKIAAVIAATAVVSSMLTVGGICYALSLTGQKIGDVLRFAGVMRFIESRYVTEIDSTKLMDGAINGMVQSLEDPHSIYLPPKMYRQFMDQTEGSFGGIGIYMGFKTGKVSVISVMDDSPAAKAGLQANDEILAVDGTPVTEMQPEEVAIHIRGQVGTEVTLSVHREGEENRDFTITRDTIQVKTAAGKMLEDGMGYIRIASFSEKTASEFENVYKSLENEGMKGLIIDLRENPGGLVTSCVEIANLVVPEGPVVSVVNRSGDKEEYTSDLKEEKYPIVVLIDGNSASAAEILAGALQDTKAGTLVGTQSYGKGSVQVIMPMFHDDAVKITIAKYYTPSGRSIDGVGIEPDVKVELRPEAASDVQLQKAEEILREKIAEKAELPYSPSS